MYRRNSDDLIRDLERRAKQDDLEAQISLLRWRLRTGKLSEDRLKVAVILDNQAASEVLGIKPEWYQHKLPPTTPTWPTFEGDKGRQLARELNEAIRIEEFIEDRRRISTETFIEMIERLHILMTTWIDQRPKEDQDRLWNAPTYMLDSMAGISISLDIYKRLNHFAQIKGQKPQDRKMIRAAVDLWKSYFSAMRRLAHHDLKISQIPELRPQIFDAWQMEFWQALLPWALGSD